VTFRPLRWVMEANPLTYGLDGLRRAMAPADVVHGMALPGWGVCTLVSVAFAGVMFLIASRIAGGKVAADWQ
jgi:ABC-2 type transport system permease protein